MLERLLRALQRLGFRDALILSRYPAEISAHLAEPSWAREHLTPHVLEHIEELPFAERVLAIDAGGYCDPRLLAVLADHASTALLIDSNPPAWQHASQPQAALVTSEWLSELSAEPPLFDALRRAADAGEIERVDVHVQDAYLPDARRSLRPLWFSAPVTAEEVRTAERLILDSTQNGTLDFPAYVHAPIETWIISRLCRTRITPNQITIFSAAISAGVTLLFATGHLIPGTLLALLVGVLDGLDGKQARVKMETTPAGRLEHALDYVLELSWWTALAYHFAGAQRSPAAYALLCLLVASDLVDRGAKKIVKRKTGRNLDDVAPIDRFVRLIGARRNIYVWMLAAGLALGAPDQAFVALCCWGACTAAVHLGRVAWISRKRLPE